MFLGNRVELSGRILLAWVLLVLVVEGSVIHVALPNALFIAF